MAMGGTSERRPVNPTALPHVSYSTIPRFHHSSTPPKK
jgi:hypothetical protein